MNNKQILWLDPREPEHILAEARKIWGENVLRSRYKPEIVQPNVDKILEVLDGFIKRLDSLTVEERSEIMETLRVLRRPIVMIGGEE